MSLTVSENSGSTIELIPEGIHLAKCISIIDLGTQIIEFDKKEKEVHQVRFEFELPNEKFTYKDKETKEEVEATRVIGANYTASLNSKAKMRKFLESWRGKKFTVEELEGFTLSKVIGKPCQLQVIHSEDGKWANISNAIPFMKGMTIPEGQKEEIVFEIKSDKKGKTTGFDEETFEKLPEWIQNKIKDSKEIKELYGITSIEDEEKELKKEVGSKKEEKTISQKDIDDVFE